MNVVKRARVSTILLFLVIAGCGRSPASPAGAGDTGPRTLYVSTTGDDRNAGTINDPWQRISYAVAQLRPGDTLYLRGGTYTGSANVIDSQINPVPSGMPSSRITVAGYPGEVVSLQPPAGTSGIRLTGGAPAYLVFQDFTIDKINETSYAEGIYLANGAHHNRFLRLEVKNNQANGVSFSNNNGNSSFNEVISCQIHDNGRAPGINTGYGVYVFTSDNLFDGNDIYNNGGYGMHFYNNAGPRDVSRNIIKNNRVYGNGTQGGANYGIVVAWGDGNEVNDNAVYLNRGGILVYTGSSNAHVRNNRVYQNGPFETILVQYASGTVLAGNTVDGEVVDLGAQTVLIP